MQGGHLIRFVFLNEEWTEEGRNQRQGACLKSSSSSRGRSGVSLINKGNSGGDKRKKQI